MYVTGGSPPDPLQAFADISAIVTAAVALLAYFHFGLRSLRQRWRLEKYLRDEAPGKRGKGDAGARTVLHLIAAIGMTETEILDAAFRSRHVKLSTAADPDTGRASAIFLKYSANPSNE